MKFAFPSFSSPAAEAPVRGVQQRSKMMEYDQPLVWVVILLMLFGMVMVYSASIALPDSPKYASYKNTHFLVRQAMFIGTSLFAGLIVFRVRVESWQRWAPYLFAGTLVLLALVLIPGIGKGVNGAKRWLHFGFNLQPSEFLKPAFAVTLAWILSWRVRDPRLPVIPIATGLVMLIAALLMAQPDFGSAILYLGTWFVLVLLSGIDLRRIGLLAGGGFVAIAATYLLYDNARHRIDSFLGGGTAFDQVDLASRTLLAGGWTGTGLWLGQRKMQLPEAHTDYIFSVIGEEFGLLVCAVVVLLYLAIVLKVIIRLVEEENLFTVLACSGLAALFGGQAFINILVNLQLFPSKGMTLPLVSYGGSSTIAQCLTVGLLLALTRRNPFLSREGLGLAGALDRQEKLR